MERNPEGQQVDDIEARRRAASILGRARTPAKSKAGRENVKKATAATRGVPLSEEMKAKLRIGQQARRERERQERESSGLQPAPKEKRPVGRPRKQPVQQSLMGEDE